ncbi:hypothetical protein F4802DRAFT_113033 [Xylaria palmicola]|nr:hypothetical protein F4802DRAFT_113033 [Xylaria palmicola]
MDDDTDESSPPRPRPTRDLPSRRAKIKVPARETRATAAYFTSSPTTQTSASSTETDRRASTRVLRSAREKRKPSVALATSTPVKSKRRRVQPAVGQTPQRPHHPHARSESAVEDMLVDGSGVFPPWHTLPYLVWLCVFEFVAAPIRDPASRIDGLAEAVGTLLSGARTCISTSEPALTALYKCPPFHRPYHKLPHLSLTQFTQTLALPPSQTWVRYRPKVKILRLDVDASLTKKVNGLQLQLKQVLMYLPRLACLELYHPADDPPYRDISTHLRWRLSKDDLLSGLGALPDSGPYVSDKSTATALKSWRWNSRLAPADLSLDHLQDIHALPSFQNLRKLAFVNYQRPSTTQFSVRARESKEAQESDLQAIAHLTSSITMLPNLRHLVIESSTLASGSMLEQLPKTLTHLELVNCSEITSDDMSIFLMSHGNSLEHLTLKHCQALSLGFLPVLGTSCPNLVRLEVDLSYFRHHASYPDNKPVYATLLEVDQQPTWPSSIQSIEIINMRNWTRAAAEMFFGSLMKNAKNLPNLRRLEFKVILNIEWRQRQEMRQSLADQMTRVFKRKTSPPKEQRSIRQPSVTKTRNLNGTINPKPAMRRSSRAIPKPSPPVSNKNGGHSSNGRGLGKVVPVRRSLRSLKCISSTFDADDEESSADELSFGDAPTRRGKGRTTTGRAAGIRHDEFIHGLCDIVDIQVDNQRPAERQYDMDDFLDSPVSSDPEWNSDDEIFD